MSKQKLIPPTIWSFVYLVLCIWAFGFHVMRHETDKFSAIFIGLLTMPWSFIESLIHDLIISPIFHFEFSYALKNITMSAWVILNTLVLYLILKKLTK
jgi:hypothetical protein